MICQEGTVVSVRKKSVSIKVISSTACGKCHAQAICNAAETPGKIINAISNDFLHVGDSVMVKIEDRLGKIAIFYGFFLPFILMVSVLFISYAFGSTEIMSAIFALTILFPYYFCLYIFRKRIEKDFVFFAEKMHEKPVTMR